MRPYFAYASNLVLDAMAQRCPGATPLGPAVLRHHRFRIARSGYATVVPARGAAVHGLLWRISSEDERRLDRYEEVSQGLYRRSVQPVETKDGRPIRALLYQTRDPAPGHPRPGYLEPVIAAARMHGFPVQAIDEIAAWLAGPAQSPYRRMIRYSASATWP
jgi:gamma-glutamylcyclotransferase (GGCT)/AIG2-like uncharacterized protein YtfP